MAIGRITGQMLSSQLNRNTTDLKFSTTGETNLLVLDASNDRIGIGTASPTVQFETTGSALIGTDLTVTGNLTVNGSTTTINTTNLTVDDKNIELAHSLSGQSPTDAAADGGGIILKGDTDHTILWSNANNSWDFSEHVNLSSGLAFKINNATVLDANNLTLENIQIAGNVITSSSNADISLQPSGTGKVVIEGIQIDGTVITGTDSTVISFGGNKLSGVGEPTGESDVATKSYVDSQVGSANTLTLGDDASNSASVNLNSGENLKFKSGNSMTLSVSGNTVTSALNDRITVDEIAAKDSSAVSIQSPTQLDSTLQVAGASTFQGDIVISSGSITSASGTIDFGDDILTTTGDVNANDITLSGNIDMTANASITIGSGDSTSDFIVNFDGTDAYITKSATSGETYIRSRNFSIQNNDGTQTFITGGHGGATELYHGGVAGPALTTTVSGGISIPNGTLLVNVIASGDSTSVRIDDSLGVDGSLDVGGTFTIANGQGITAILDEDNMASNSANALATQQSIKAYVDSVAGGTITLGDSASNTGSVDINAGQDLEFRAGNSITPTVSGNGVTIALDSDITVNSITSADSSFVRINDSLETEAAQINQTLTVDGDAQIKGNLTVQGTTTYIETTNTKISDPLLLLNNGNSGGADIDAGIMIERGSAGNNAVFYWNEGDDRFKAVLTTSGQEATSVTDSSYATLNVGGLVMGSESVVVTSILDEDTLSSDSDTAIPTQQSVKAYVDTEIAGLSQTIKVSDDTSTVLTLDLKNDTMSLAGGNSITSSISGDTVTFDLNDDITVNQIGAKDSSAVSITSPLQTGTIQAAGNITVNGGTVTAGSGSSFGDLTLGDGSITDASGTIDFGDENLDTTGNITATGGTVTANQFDVGTLSITDGQITDTDGTIGFNDINLDGIDQLTTSSIVTNVISSSASTSVVVNDGLQVDGSLDVGTNFTISNGTSINAILDEDNMASDSDTALATQQSIKAYVDSVAGGTITLGDSASNSGSVNINAGQDLEFRSGDSITLTVSGNGVTADLNETISVDTITAGDSTAITMGSPVILNSTLKFNGDAQTITQILDEDNFASNSATALATQQSIKAYVDAVAQGLHVHASVHAITNTPLATITGDTVTYNNGSSGVGATLTLDTALDLGGGDIDGDTDLQVGDRIIVNGESTAAHNGIYVITTTSLLTRATDFDTPAEMAGGDFVFVTHGTLYADTGWVLGEPVTTVGTTNVEFIQFSGAGAFTAGDGLTLTGTEFSVNVDSSTIEINADTLRVKDAGITNVKLANSTITVVGDDSTGTAVSLGETFKIAGGESLNASVSADTLTVNLDDNITVNQIGAKDSSAVSITSALQTTSIQSSGAVTVNGTFTIGTGSGVTTILDEDTLSSDSDTALATQQSIKAYVDSVAGGTITLGDSASNAGSVDINAGQDLEFRSGDSITMTVSGNGVTTALNDNITVNQIGAKDSTAVSITSNTQVDGTLQVSGTSTLVGNTTIAEDITIASGSITSASGSISFGNENLTTTGNITGSNITATGNIQVNGDLTVSGTTTSVNSTNLTVSDPLLILSETNSGGADVDSGIMVERGSAGNNAALYWNEGDDKFKAVLTTSQGDATSIVDTSVATIVANIESTGSSVFGDITVNQIGANDSSAVSITSPLQTSTIQASGNIVVNGGTVTAGSGSSFGDLTLSDGSITDASGTIDFGDENLDTTGNITATGGTVTANQFDVGTLSITDGQITDTDGTIGFNDINLDGIDTLTASTIDTNVIQSTNSTKVNVQDSLEVDGSLDVGSNFTISNGTSINAILDEDTLSSDSDTALATQQSIKAYVDTQIAASTVALLNDVGDVDAQAGDKQDGDVLVVNDDSSNTFTLSSQLTTGMRLPTGTTAQRPPIYSGVIRYNTTTGLYEGSTDGSTWSAFAMAGNAETLTKDVFTGNGGATYNFSNITDPTSGDGNNGALGLIVYIDNVLQEPTQNYTISPTAITFDSNVHSGARIVVIQGFDGGAGGAGGGAGFTTITNSDVDSAVETIDSWAVTTYRAAHYHYVIENDDVNEYQTGQIHVIHDGTNALFTEFGALKSPGIDSTVGPNDLITFSVDISGSDVRLRGSAQAPNCKIKLKRIHLEVQ